MERIHEELYKKDLNELDYYNGVVSDPEPDILECKVKRALRSIAANKASGCDEIPAELFKSLKDDAIRFCIHYVSNLSPCLFNLYAEYIIAKCWVR